MAEEEIEGSPLEEEPQTNGGATNMQFTQPFEEEKAEMQDVYIEISKEDQKEE